MTNNKILALVMVVIGMILLLIAYQSSQSMGDQVTEAFTGRFTDSTIWLLIIGAASAVAGIGMFVFGRQR